MIYQNLNPYNEHIDSDMPKFALRCNNVLEASKLWEFLCSTLAPWPILPSKRINLLNASAM